MEKLDLMSMDLDELEKLFSSIGEKKFRAAQLFKFIHNEKGNKIDDITVFSKKLREQLEEFTAINPLQIIDRIDSKQDSTKKFIFQLSDGNIIETVFMKSISNTTICVSTQVGCKMGCSFCASTQNGYKRNLRPSEILNQIYQVEENLKTRIDNIVLMGIGEPLDNFDNVVKFIRLINDELGHKTSIRNITISTSGLVNGIKKLADTEMQVNLALSLHNGIQSEREQIMPIAKSNPLTEIKEALEYYQKKTKRRVSYEYVVIKDENDSFDHARAIKNMCVGLDSHVNLIPLNPVKEFGKAAPQDRDIDEFKNKLENLGINVTVRRKQGTDIDAACGQLRNKYESTMR